MHTPKLQQKLRLFAKSSWNCKFAKRAITLGSILRGAIIQGKIFRGTIISGGYFWGVNLAVDNFPGGGGGQFSGHAY